MRKKSILVGAIALGLLTATSIYSCKNANKTEDTTEKAADAKCGEGKCGNSTKSTEAKCGDKVVDSTSMKTKEGKCGEGKCGDKK